MDKKIRYVNIDGADDPIDGFPFNELDPTLISILSKEVHNLEASIAKAKLPKSIKLDAPKYASVTIEYTLDADKKIILTSGRELKDNEQYKNAHKELYFKCLESLAEVI